MTQQDTKIIAAIELPIAATERETLIDIVRRHAERIPGLHIDDASEDWNALEARKRSGFGDRSRTIYLGVWQGSKDDTFVADVSDAGHLGRVWITFADGNSAVMRFREDLTSELVERWPSAQSLPILPSGGLPLVNDLQISSQGYKIKRAEAASYGLPHSSPLVADD